MLLQLNPGKMKRKRSSWGKDTPHRGVFLAKLL